MIGNNFAICGDGAVVKVSYGDVSVIGGIKAQHPVVAFGGRALGIEQRVERQRQHAVAAVKNRIA